MPKKKFKIEGVEGLTPKDLKPKSKVVVNITKGFIQLDLKGGPKTTTKPKTNKK